MEDESHRFIRPQPIRQQFNPQFREYPRNESKSCSYFLLKILIIALFLSVIPLFPSEPPEFISNTVFAKSWELIHLLVIGIVLSYGLFSRRKAAQKSPPKAQFSQAYTPNILNHSTLFDYEGETLADNCGKNGVIRESCDLSYLRTEPYVVLRRESGEKIEEGSLGLPVRSLRSRVVDSESEEECVSECQSDLSGESTCSESSSAPGNGEDENFEGNVRDNPSSMGGKSRSIRPRFMAENGIFQTQGDEGENSEGNVGSSASMPWESWSMRPGFVVGNSTFESDMKYGNLEENMGNYASPIERKPRPMRPGLMAENGIFQSHGGVDENLEGNVGGNPSPGGWKSRSMRPGFMAKDGTFESQGGEGQNLEGNVGGNPSPRGWKSRSMRPGFMAEDGTFESQGGEGENLEENVENSSSMSWKSRSMRANFMAENGTFGSRLSKSRPVRSPTQEAASCGINSGFCSRLPESPNMVEQNTWRKVNYNMPLPNFSTQMNDFSRVGPSPNLVNTTSTFVCMPTTATSPSMPVSATDCAPYFGIHSPFVPTHVDNFASLAASSGNRTHTHEPILQFDNMASSREGNNWYAPQFADPFSVPTPKDDGSSPMTGSFLKKNEEIFITHTPAPVTPSVPTPATYCTSSVKTSRRSKFNYGPSLKKDMLRSEKEDNNVESFVEGNSSYASHVVDPVARPTPKGDVTSTNGSFPKTNKDLFMPPAPTNDDISPANGSIQKNEDLFMPQAPVTPSTTARADDLTSSVKASRRSKPSLKKNKLRSEKVKNDVESFVERNNSYAPHVTSPVSVPTPKDEVTPPYNGSFPKNEDLFIPPATVPPSVSASADDFVSPVTAQESAKFDHGPPVKKDEEESEKETAKSSGPGNQSHNPHAVDPFSVSTPKDYVTSSTDVAFGEKNEQRSIPLKWDDDCFVLPSSEINNDMESLLQDDPAPELANSSEGVSSAGSSSRISCDGLSSPVNRLQENDSSSASTKSTMTENLSREIVSFKPSTPSPPQQILTRKNDIASSVESSSRALEDRSLLNEKDDQGSPPTPKRGKALSKPSHSRGFSCTSFFDRDLRKSLKNEAKEASRKSKGEQYARGSTCGWDCMKLDVKPTSSKASLKGKSVRTIKPREVVLEINSQGELSKDELKNDQIEDKQDIGERKEQKQEMVVIQIGISEKKSSSNGGKHENHVNAGTSIIVGLNSKDSSNGKTAVLCEVKEEEPDTEIDKKADEFIAKFKEQIRLQKVAATAVSSRRKRQQNPQRNPLYQT